MLAMAAPARHPMATPSPSAMSVVGVEADPPRRHGEDGEAAAHREDARRPPDAAADVAVRAGIPRRAVVTRSISRVCSMMLILGVCCACFRGHLDMLAGDVPEWSTRPGCAPLAS